MADARWSIAGDSSEASLFALEAAVSTSCRIATSIRCVAGGYGSADDTPPLPLLLETEVFAGAPAVHAWHPKISPLIDSSSRNICLFTGGLRDVTSGVIDTLARYDEVWTPFGIVVGRLRDAGVNVRDVVLPNHSWPATPVPEMSHPIVLCHDEWRGDGRGVQALIRAWLTSGLSESAGCLLLSVPDLDAPTLQSFITTQRAEVKCEDVNRHRIKILNSPSAGRLQSCVAASDVVVCCHLGDAGWRWSAAKAIASGKALISTHIGDVLNQVADCSWVEVSKDMNSLTDGLRRALEGTPVIARGHDWMSVWSFTDFCETRLTEIAKKGK